MKSDKAVHKSVPRLSIIAILTILATSFSIVSAQDRESENIVDLTSSSYEELYKMYSEVYTDTLLSKRFINAYLQKAAVEGNLLELVRSLTWSSYYEEIEERKLQLLDSAIQLSKKIDTKNYPIVSISTKAGHFLDKGNYEIALNLYLEVLALAKKKNNKEYEYITKHNIGVIKGEIGKDNEALKLFQECMGYEKSKNEFNSYDYLNLLLYLGEYSIKNGLLDDAKINLAEGKIKSEGRFDDLFHQFLLQEGIYYFVKKEYGKASQIIKECNLKLNYNLPENNRIGILTQYYLGILSITEKNSEMAKIHFQTMDSLIAVKGYQTYEVRNGYLFLIEYFEKRDELKMQLNYVNRLLKFDSINTHNGIEMSNRLYTEFDTPLLINERNEIITNLENKSKKANNWLYLSLFFACSFSIGFIYLYKRNKLLYQRFEDLLESTQEKPDVNTLISSDIGHIASSKLDISEEIVQRVLRGLEEFEKTRGYLKSSVSSKKLAEKLETNTSYLSSIINVYKQKNFSSYIKDLRIAFVVEELKTNAKLRRYSIEGISEEIGFKNSESFSIAFKQKTGLRPSYYIKKLQEKGNLV